MPRTFEAWVLAAVVAGSAGCKDPETAAQQAKLQTTQQKLAEGRQLIAQGKYEAAVAAARAAASASPNDPAAYLLMADAQRESGNDAAAILSLKQTADLAKDSSPVIRKQLAEIYRKSGNRPQAPIGRINTRDESTAADSAGYLGCTGHRG